MIENLIVNFQKKTDETILARTQDAPCEVQSIGGILEAITKSTPELASECFGEVGKDLYNFAKDADLFHPDLKEILGGILCEGSQTSRTFCSILKMMEYASSLTDYECILNFMQGSISQCEGFGALALSIGNPQCADFHGTRFIKDKDLRESIRKRRKSQDMILASFYADNRDSWDYLPANFDEFSRGETPFSTTIGIMKKRKEIFLKKGMVGLASGLDNRLRLLENMANESYFGFNRVPFKNAAVILAKMHNFTFAEMPKSRIRVGPKLSERLDKESCSDFVAKKMGTEYQPRVYSIDDFQEETVSKRGMKIIEYLDHFPECGNKPAFDHYCIMVPSLTKSGVENNPLEDSKVDPKNHLLDTLLVRKKVFYPILFGLRDEKSYFIDFWYG